METDNGKKKTNAPPLRFPGFEGEWEERRLGEVAEFSSVRIKTSVLDQKNYISTENMQQDFQGVVEAKSVPSNTNAISFSNGDILISNIRPYLKKVWKATFDGGCSSDVFVLKARGAIDNDYLYYTIANYRFIDYVTTSAKGVKMPRGDKKQIVTYQLSFPSLPEQRKIADFLRLLDERIAVQRALIGEMGRLMGGIREWLFAHTDGKCVRLADVCKIVKGQQVNKQELNESGPYYVMNGGTTPSGYYSKSNTGTGVISISEGGNSCGYVQWNENPFWSGGHCYTIVDISKDAVPHFLYQYLKHKESDIMKLRIGSGLPNIQKKTLECFTVKLPSFTEQTKISTALKAVDLRAKNAEELLRLLLKQKSFFLQKLFI